uniref:Uncharacterized protein n=1 Tax=Anguilla anguilla TaxID=7936 RepID=A0A0E9V0V1_ANGAN
MAHYFSQNIKVLVILHKNKNLHFHKYYCNYCQT